MCRLSRRYVICHKVSQDQLTNVLQDDLANFHVVHFSTCSVEHFATQFLGPVEEEYAEEAEEDDGLGYYDDGVKRTLTDAQIAIFRHSEIQALLRERRHTAEAKAVDVADQPLKPSVDQGESEEGELGDVNANESSTDPPALHGQHLNRKARKAQQAKQKGYFKQKIKPDLRKRTWDKVDSGMESLDYDDQSSSPHVANLASQRRRISYDD
jgi:hypothetical protein